MWAWHERKSCGRGEGAVSLGPRCARAWKGTNRGDGGGEGLDLALLGRTVLEAGEEVLGVKLVEVGDCERGMRVSGGPFCCEDAGRGRAFWLDLADERVDLVGLVDPARRESRVVRAASLRDCRGAQLIAADEAGFFIAEVVVVVVVAGEGG